MHRTSIVPFDVTSEGCHSVIDRHFDHYGYTTITVKGKRIKMHRYMYELYKGPIPEGMFVCHHCDNPACINLDHLFIGSPADNMLDKVNKHRQARGEAINRNILKEEDVQYIRSMNGSMTQQSLADMFGTTQVNISRVQLNRIWRHV